MTFEPRIALTAAETHVEFDRINAHILQQRISVENACMPVLRRLEVLAEGFVGLMPIAVVDALAFRLQRALDRTAVFGFRHAQQELIRLRAHRDPVRAYAIPDTGEYARLAAGGLDQIRVLIHRRSREVTQSITDAVNEAASQPGLDGTARTLAIAAAGRRALHNNVLELVGETLNMGRTAGAMALPTPPEFALRSEQLDAATCPECEREHGGIYQLGTDEYFAHLPPSYCLGGGRCRGVYVFGDGPVDFRVPLPEAA